MSSRQQLLYALEKSKETSQGESRSVPDDQMNELIEFIQDESLRVTFTQKTLPPSSKQDLRNKLTEESLKVYRPIKKLVFLERKHAKPALNEIMVCSCKPPVKITEGEYNGHSTVGCGKKCLNRVVSTECCSSLCPTGDNCTNRRFQLYQYAQVFPIKTQNRGWGLAAGQFIKKGQFVIEYLGEVFSTDSDLGRTRLNKYKTEPCTYLMSTSHNEVIDPARKGNMARFINHSCDPNCETQKWNVMGEVCVGIFAKKNINEEEELTFDYRLDTHKTQLTKCLCGSKNCRQYLGLIPSNYSSAEQWLKKLKSIKCTGCRKSSGNDDKSLILCDKCNKGWHIQCLKVPLKAVPEDSWVCETCSARPRNADDDKKRNKAPEADIKVFLERRQFDILRKHLEEIIELDVKLFWDNNISQEGKIEVLIRGVKAKQAEKLIQDLSKHSVLASQVEDEVTEIVLRIETIYLKSVLNFYKTLNISANIDYDKIIDLDQIYSITQISKLYITGRKSEIMSLAESILDHVDHLVIFTLLVSNTEAKVFEQNLFMFKSMIFPVEVRLCEDKIVNESPHPFFFYSREERKLLFIGTES
jgi:hypothetical protein